MAVVRTVWSELKMTDVSLAHVGTIRNGLHHAT